MITYLNSWLLDTLNTILYVFIAILVFALLITIHELGHYTFGKIFKFKINEFSIGFGKAIFQHTSKNGEVFAIRIIPLGGYCAFEGEDEDNHTEGAFNDQAWWKRLIVLFGGVLFNFISACIVAIPLLMVVGNAIPRVDGIETDSPNAAVLEVGDVILEVDGTKPTFLNGGLESLMSGYEAGEKFELTIQTPDGSEKTVQVEKYEKLYEGETEPSLVLGITRGYVKYGFFQSVAMSVPFCGEMGWECLKILGKLVIGQQSISELGGPITTVKAIAKVTQVNMLNLLLFFPLIAVNLAVFNALPIPALDGARMVFVIIEAIRKKPIDRKIENRIHTIGIMVLFAFIVVVDLLQLFVFRMF